MIELCKTLPKYTLLSYNPATSIGVKPLLQTPLSSNNGKLSVKRVGLIKRVIVIVYDGLLLFSVLFFTSALWMLLFNLVAPDSLYLDASKLANNKLATFTELGKGIAFSLIILNCLVVSFIFYGWFWTHGGQTLGMRVWHLYLTDPNGKFIDWKSSAKRYLMGLLTLLPFGIGLLWILFNNKRKALHDVLSDTQIVFHKPKP